MKTKSHTHRAHARPIATFVTPQATATGAEPEEMGKAIAFRLSAEEHDALKRRGRRCGTPLSLALRSMLVTHLLVSQPRITSVTFQGGYRATQNRHRQTWSVVGNDGTILHRNLDRDEALLRSEWIAQLAAGPASTARPLNMVAFRLSVGEHSALVRLSAANDTTPSAVLRGFLTTLLARRQRLLEVCFGNDYRAYSDRDGWCVAVGHNVVAARLSREDALQRADWLSQAGHAAAS